MSDIDTRLDEILLKDLILATDDGQPYIKYTDTAVEAIKQLMADEFKKLIGEDDEYDALTIDSDYDYAARNQLRNELRQKLEEWKQ